MTKRIAIAIICITLFYFIYRNVGLPHSVSPSPVPTAVPEITTASSLTYQDVTYDYHFFRVDTIRAIKLIPNFYTPSRASQLAEANGCVLAINGGFYSEENAPLGAFIAGSAIQSKAIPSTLLNGFFGFTDTHAAITADLDTTYPSVLQSGPLLFWDNQPLPLAIRNDEHARRSAVILSEQDQVLFVTFYIRDSIYNGPLLGDLPAILGQFAADQGITVHAALNLDGGSASYFKNSEVELPELSPIGSMICIQN